MFYMCYFLARNFLILGFLVRAFIGLIIDDGATGVVVSKLAEHITLRGDRR